jgi:hypothetical protein
MAVQFQNYDHSFKLKGKFIFSPSILGRKIESELKDQIFEIVTFRDYFYHLAKGGHIEALHAHRSNQYFSRIDLSNFFYTIGRNRITRALRDAGISRAIHFSKWSTVKNPYPGPSYALPYGFVQSPILASLVLQQSEVTSYLDLLPGNVCKSVYVDDITLSSNSLEELNKAHEGLLNAVDTSGFATNPAKLIAPRSEITVFNCGLQSGKTAVTADRIAEFNATVRSQASTSGFEKYVADVERGNIDEP